jgi:hypothetical protein
MQTISINTSAADQQVQHHNKGLLVTIKNWIHEQEPAWEHNRLGISAVGIFIQVTFAAAMIVILPLANASPWAYGTGVFLTFMANSIAFGQAPIRWVLGSFVVSITINFLLSLFYIVPLLMS